MQQYNQDEETEGYSGGKEQEKCPTNQTKEEEIGSLPEKAFQILILKMIQNLDIKMESQINSLETRIEKMEERFNKDLEEIKKSQYIMNNAQMRSKTLWRQQIVEWTQKIGLVR